jgi:2-polyprenyl-3-methyl-5-hydroxy-6-metoxy-1,4-benzoquinol methylase
MDRHASTNIKLWNELAAHHSRLPAYGYELLAAGGITLHHLEREAVGNVEGKRLLHLMCHIGTDSLSWVRLGATVTGVDFSSQAIEVAIKFSRDLQLSASFANCGIEEIGNRLPHRSWDLIIATYGVLEWIPNLHSVVASIKDLLAPKGTLLIIDAHPLANSLWEAKDCPHGSVHLGDSYFSTTRPQRQVMRGSYVDREIKLQHTVNYKWRHSIADLINAVVEAGLELTLLREHPFLHYQKFPDMVCDSEGFWHLPQLNLPLMLELRAKRS